MISGFYYMSRSHPFVPGVPLERSRKRPWYHMRLGGALAALLALVLIWHLALWGAMRERFDERVKINPITNVMRVPYRIESSSGTVTTGRRVVTTRMGREILEGALRERARQFLDVYALLIPWRVEFELVEPPSSTEEPAR
ncbi:MAG: hypothetical protein GWN99_00085 [Gemmatimonadetes bacterium]|nr:hypothetical protein [Gemmatimonadota bacterium]NIV23617.1 hypothetical protein [Gemmatimonadota bacterium]